MTSTLVFSDAREVKKYLAGRGVVPRSVRSVPDPYTGGRRFSVEMPFTAWRSNVRELADSMRESNVSIFHMGGVV